MSKPKTRQLKDLRAYGAKKARELGITGEDDVNRLVHEHRTEMWVNTDSEKERKRILKKTSER